VLTIRDAQPEDAMEVARVHLRSWQVAYRDLLPDDYLRSLRPEDRAAGYTFGPGPSDQPATLVAVADGVIQGFATTGPTRDEDIPGWGEVYALYAAPEAFGTGLGRDLMTEARHRLASGGYSDAALWVLADNPQAIRFYRAGGWQPDGRRETFELGGIFVDEVRYRRSLP
jgi:ribosomal protein S18 acetylase RimI-like enzyme